MSDDAPAAARAIETLLARRTPGATICPSEAARLATGDGGDWRAAMPAVHEAAGGLADAGQVRLNWRGERRARAEGPYRIGRAVATDGE